MDTHDCIKELRKINRMLRTKKLKKFLLDEDPDIFEKVIDYRSELVLLIGKIENAGLAKIADKFDEIAEDFKKATTDLDKFTKSLNDGIAIANTVATIVGLAARVAALAV